MSDLIAKRWRRRALEAEARLSELQKLTADYVEANKVMRKLLGEVLRAHNDTPDARAKRNKMNEHDHSPRIDIEGVARVCHEANRAYALMFGDTSHEHWDSAPEWQRESARKGVAAIMEGAVSSPEESHTAWSEEKRKNGWSFGAVKDPEKKTHPCLVPWSELPEYQRRKDILFQGVVRALVA